MADLVAVHFNCPHCHTLHEKHIDAGVFCAEIVLRCPPEEGGCMRYLLLRYFHAGELEVEPLTSEQALAARKSRHLIAE